VPDGEFDRGYRLIREKDAKDMTAPERDALVGIVYSKLMEIESRLLPCGLHVIGKPPTAQRRSPLWSTLPVLIGLKRRSSACLELLLTVRRNIGQVYQNNHGILEDVQLLQDITSATRAAVAVQSLKQMLMVVSPKSPSSTFFNMGKKRALD